MKNPAAAGRQLLPQLPRAALAQREGARGGERRSDVVGIYPNDAALVRLAGALLIEQNDEWLVGRRYLSEESPAAVLARSTDAAGVVEVGALPAA